MTHDPNDAKTIRLMRELTEISGQRENASAGYSFTILPSAIAANRLANTIGVVTR